MSDGFRRRWLRPAGSHRVHARPPRAEGPRHGRPGKQGARKHGGLVRKSDTPSHNGDTYERHLGEQRIIRLEKDPSFPDLFYINPNSYIS